jgi:hypothetical protein
MDVRDAINGVVNYNMGTIHVFEDVNLIVYGGEAFKSRYISKLVT